jgi:hypothetical protein
MSNGDSGGSLAEPLCQACDRHHAYEHLHHYLFRLCNVADLQQAHKMADLAACHLREQTCTLERLRESTRSKHAVRLEEAIKVKLERRDMIHNVIMHRKWQKEQLTREEM